MKQFFLWFYCLPILAVLLLLLAGTSCFLFLRRKFGSSAFWKISVMLLLLGWCCIILYGTLWQRSAGTYHQPVLMPFSSLREALNGGPRELYRTIFMNAVLFYPAGLLSCEFLPGRLKAKWNVLPVTILFLFVSMGIEFTQYRIGLGIAETDDVIHNTLGAFLGALTCCSTFPDHQK